jgi:pyruvate,water dikinase
MALGILSSFRKPETGFRARYETLRSLLNRNGHVLQLLSDLEADLNHLPHSDQRIRRPVERLLSETLLMVQELNILAEGRYLSLYKVLEGIRTETLAALHQAPGYKNQPLAVSLDAAESKKPGLAGGKAAGLAALRRVFPDAVPPGFTLTTAAYRLFLDESGLSEKLRLLARNLDPFGDPARFHQTTEAIRSAILATEVPEAVSRAIYENARLLGDAGPSGWAVRSSATSEDGQFSFAGQFDTELRVPPEKLVDAYRAVCAGRFTDRAVIYRAACGFREADTPMAVLFMPMVEPRAAGVLYSMDTTGEDRGRMAVFAAAGLGDAVVRGEIRPDIFYLARGGAFEVLEGPEVPHVTKDTLSELGKLADGAARALGAEVEMEWAAGRDGRLWLLQCRPLRPGESEPGREGRAGGAPPLIEGGVTIFPGRAEGPVARRSGPDTRPVPKGAVLVVDSPAPELAAFLPNAAALVAEAGGLTGHLATLAREFSIPSVFHVGVTARRLEEGMLVSVDATKRKIHAGSRWPGIRERVLDRLSRPPGGAGKNPLFGLVLALNLVDPFVSSFRPKACRSIHDIIRFVHEMGVRYMFRFGDAHSRPFQKKTRRLETRLPMKIYVLDIAGAIRTDKKTVPPETVESTPFQALWKGFADPALAWPDRWNKEFAGMPRGFQEEVLGGLKGPRRGGDPNYLIVAPEYMNFNARFAYHYAMVDAFVGPGGQNNYVHFRFHNGGASDERRTLRARFLERVLRESRFGVDRQGDLITAWMRRYPQNDSKEALAVLGRLMVCARQLDLLMCNENDVAGFSAHFMSGNFRAFA